MPVVTMSFCCTGYTTIAKNGQDREEWKQWSHEPDSGQRT